MTPKIKTNWQLYTQNLEISYPNMKSWVEENNSLMNRLRSLETKIDTYSQLISSFKQSKINLNRKMLAQMAVLDCSSFYKLIDHTKSLN